MLAKIEREKQKTELAKLGFITKGTELIKELAEVERFNYEKRYKILNKIKELKMLFDECDNVDFFIAKYEEITGEPYEEVKKMKWYSFRNKKKEYFGNFDAIPYDIAVEVGAEIVIETYFSTCQPSEALTHSVENLIKDDVIWLDDIADNYNEEFVEKLEKRGYGND